MNPTVHMPCPVAHWANVAPDGIALRPAGQPLTWWAWNRRVASCTAALVAVGITPGDRVGLPLAPGVEFLTLLIALFRLGAVACPVNPGFPPKYRAKLLRRLGCALIVVDEKGNEDEHSLGVPVRRLTDFTPPIPPQAGGTHSMEESENGELPDSRVDNVLPPACGGAGGGSATAIASSATWRMDIPATIIFTSGSTGDPKAAALSLGNHLASARQANANIPLAPGDTWLLSLPLHHVAGFGVLFRCLQAGATIALPCDTPIPAAIRALKATHVSLVARQLATLLDDGPLPPLKAVLLGGSAIPGPLIDRAVAAGLPIHTSYGMTEMATQVAATRPGASREELNSSGKPLAPDSVRLTSDGVIQVGGPARFLGYWINGNLETPFDDDGFFTTNDCGYLDENGLLHVTGRRDNMFVAGGENVQPEDIERALLQLPGISQAVVVPVPHPTFGATPVAFVQGDGSLDPEAVRLALLDQLPRHMVPQHVFPWPEEPGEGTIKVNRNALAGIARHLASAQAQQQ